MNGYMGVRKKVMAALYQWFVVLQKNKTIFYGKLPQSEGLRVESGQTPESCVKTRAGGFTNMNMVNSSILAADPISTSHVFGPDPVN